jgi:hypothetical protein
MWKRFGGNQRFLLSFIPEIMHCIFQDSLRRRWIRSVRQHGNWIQEEELLRWVSFQILFIILEWSGNARKKKRDCENYDRVFGTRWNSWWRN